MRKILMTRDNPEGLKLEEVLQTLVEEIAQKSDYIRSSKHVLRDEILASNSRITSRLLEALNDQVAIYRKLDAISPNRGPLNPRL